jgi:hypothetical protein
MFRTSNTGLGGYGGVIGAFSLGDHHVSHGNKRKMNNSYMPESVFKKRGNSLNMSKNEELDMNEYRGNLYKETLPFNTTNAKLKLQQVQASDIFGSVVNRGEFFDTHLDRQGPVEKSHAREASTFVKARNIRYE